MKDRMHGGAEMGRVFVEPPVSQLLGRGLVMFVPYLCTTDRFRRSRLAVGPTVLYEL